MKSTRIKVSAKVRKMFKEGWVTMGYRMAGHKHGQANLTEEEYLQLKSLEDNKKGIVVPKYPRIQVSQKRHVALQREANRKGISLTELAEQKFKMAK